MSVPQLDLIGIVVEDMARALAFYRQLGLEVPADADTEDETIRRETSRELRGAIDALPDDQSRVIQLAYFGGFSHSEIAEMLGMPLGTVKGRMRLGLEKIRAQIAESITPEGALETR